MFRSSVGPRPWNGARKPFAANDCLMQSGMLVNGGLYVASAFARMIWTCTCSGPAGLAAAMTGALPCKGLCNFCGGRLARQGGAALVDTDGRMQPRDAKSGALAWMVQSTRVRAIPWLTEAYCEALQPEAWIVRGWRQRAMPWCGGMACGAHALHACGAEQVWP